MKKIIGSIFTMVMAFSLLATTAFASNIQVVENDAVVNEAEIIANEIIISVTKEYDGTLNQELKDLGVISVENIFDVDDTIMYLIKTEIAQDNIIADLEKLSYVNYAEYNQIGQFAEESLPEATFPTQTVVISVVAGVVILGIVVVVARKVRAK